MTRRKQALRVCVMLVLGGLLTACSSDVVDVGKQDTSNAPLYQSSLECVPGEPWEPVVDWEGYVENGIIELASERVRIRQPTANEDGFVIFGSGPRLPAPTDPNAGWPCPELGGGYLLPGHPYTIEKASITDFRMRFRIASFEPMDPWCALHGESSVSPGQPDGICESRELITLPDGSMTQSPGAMICHMCECDSAGCRARWRDEPISAAGDGIYYEFDLGIEGDFADGSVRNLLPDISASIGNITERARFHRVQ